MLKCVLFAKDFVGQTLRADTHATLAWARVCMLLPVNPSKNHCCCFFITATSYS